MCMVNPRLQFMMRFFFFCIVKERLSLPKENVDANKKHVYVHQVLCMNTSYSLFQTVFIFKHEVKTSKKEIFNVVFYTFYHFQVLRSLKITIHKHKSV